MVGCVARGEDRAEMGTFRFDDIPVFEDLESAVCKRVGIGIGSLGVHVRRPRQFVDRHRAEMLADLVDTTDVIWMRVGENDAFDFSAAGPRDGLFENGHVLGMTGAGIEQQALGSGTDEIGVGAGAREHARVLT